MCVKVCLELSKSLRCYFYFLRIEMYNKHFKNLKNRIKRFLNLEKKHEKKRDSLNKIPVCIINLLMILSHFESRVYNEHCVKLRQCGQYIKVYFVKFGYNFTYSCIRWNICSNSVTLFPYICVSNKLFLNKFDEEFCVLLRIW